MFKPTDDGVEIGAYKPHELDFHIAFKNINLSILDYKSAFYIFLNFYKSYHFHKNKSNSEALIRSSIELIEICYICTRLHKEGSRTDFQNGGLTG